MRRTLAAVMKEGECCRVAHTCCTLAVLQLRTIHWKLNSMLLLALCWLPGKQHCRALLSLHVCMDAALAGVFNYAHTPRNKWITDCLGMVTLAGSQVWWTWETEDSFRQVREGDKHAMKTYAAKLTKQLTQLTGMVSGVGPALSAQLSKGLRSWLGSGLWHPSLALLEGTCCRLKDRRTSRRRRHRLLRSMQVRSDLSNDARRKVNTLIITDVHARDIIDKFVRDSIMDTREFAWESQLRFYWDKAVVSGRPCHAGGHPDAWREPRASYSTPRRRSMTPPAPSSECPLKCQ